MSGVELTEKQALETSLQTEIALVQRTLTMDMATVRQRAKERIQLLQKSLEKTYRVLERGDCPSTYLDLNVSEIHALIVELSRLDAMRFAPGDFRLV